MFLRRDDTEYSDCLLRTVCPSGVIPGEVKRETRYPAAAKAAIKSPVLPPVRAMDADRRQHDMECEVRLEANC